jgi:hypothetical protein
MIIFNELKTYKFENPKNYKNKIHIPRIYLNDFNQINDCLKALKKHQYLNNKELPNAVASTRNEASREIFSLLWRLNIGVEVVRDKSTYSFKFTEKLNEFIDDEEKYQKYFYKFIYQYLPISSVLNYINILNEDKKNITEKIIEDKFHKTYSAGNSDNIHPILRMLKGFKIILDDCAITTVGKQILKNSSLNNPYYYHQKVDEINNKFEILVLEIMHQLSLSETQQFKIDNFKKFNFLSEFHKDQLSKTPLEKIYSNLKNLEKKFPIKVNGEDCIILNPVFFDIKAIDYINNNLNKNFRSKNKTEGLTKLMDFKKYQPIVIYHLKKKINLENCKYINYEIFMHSYDKIIDAAPKFIILDKKWGPLSNVEISGFLNAYVRFGGNLVIIDSQPGRLGANHNQFQWLPEELSKLQYLSKGCFKFTIGSEKLVVTKKISQKLLNNKPGEYKKLVLSYNKGTFTFISSKAIDKLNFDDKIYSNKISINSNSKNWENAKIVHICANIIGERNLYNPIRDFMKNNFGFKFKENWSDWSTTDLFSISPFKCLFEVNVVGKNQLIAGPAKVSEVDRHYREMKRGKKRISNLDLTEKFGRCVIAYDFSRKDGKGRSGSIETAEDYKVNLIRYRDLYDMSCMDLNHEDLKELLFDWDGEPEVSKKLQKYI